MKNLKSKKFPDMNPFLDLLTSVLNELPNNPKPNCTGFCLTHYDFHGEVEITEKLGEVAPEKRYKYFRLANMKVFGILSRDVNRSKEFENKKLEQFPGGVRLYQDCTGVSGHDSMIDEAIATLWLVTMNNFFKAQMRTTNPMEKEKFWVEVAQIAEVTEKNLMPDNTWVSLMGEMLLMRFRKENS